MNRRGPALPGLRLAVAALGLALLVVILGAWTRLDDAGLGCPDWPGCYGLPTVPTTNSELLRAEELYPDSPVDAYKAWLEMAHRYCAGVLGLLILALALLAIRQRTPAYPLKLCLALAALVIVQAAFGAWTVTLRLWPQVVTLHLLGGFALVGLLAILVLRLSGYSLLVLPGTRRLSAARILAAASVVLVGVQIFLGGWTSANYAALACPDFPTCQGAWWPAADFVQGFAITRDPGPDYQGGLMTTEARTAVHFSHRLGALIVLVFLGASLCVYHIWGMAPIWIGLIGGLLALQLALGIGNILLHVPLGVALAHHATGAVLLAILIALNYSLHSR